MSVTRSPRWQGAPLLWSYPRNFVPGGPSCRMRLTRLSPSFRGGGAVGRCSLLIPNAAQRGSGKDSLNTTRNWANTLTNPSPVCTHTLKHHVPQELSSCGPHFYDATSKPLPLHHGGHRGQTVSLHQPACDPCGCRTLSWGYNDPQSVVTTTAHRTASGVHHEADQEAEGKTSTQKLLL